MEATTSEVPIVIGSDDESDNDDVVLIKEEIEVDSEDVIFLSEDKPPPKPETLTINSDTAASRNDSGANHDNTKGSTTLNRSQSVTTCTQHLSLDNNGDSRLMCNSVPQLGSINNSAGPLDLSAKTCDDTVMKGGYCTASANMMFDEKRGFHTVGNMSNQSTSESFASLMNSAFAKMQSSLDSLNASTAQISSTYTHSCDKSVSTAIEASNNYGVTNGTLHSNASHQSEQQTFDNQICTSQAITLNPPTLQQTSDANLPVITWAPPSFSLGPSVISDIGTSCTSTMMSNTGTSTYVTSPASTDPSNSSLSTHLDSRSSSLDQATSVIVNSTSGASPDSSGISPSPAADVSKIPGSSHSVSAILSDKRTQKPHGLSIQPCDSFATSHLLLSALDPMWSPNSLTGAHIQSGANDVSQSGTVTQSGFSSVTQSNFSPVTQSNFSPVTQSNFNFSAVTQSGYQQKSDIPVQSTNCVLGLPGGSLASVPQFSTSGNFYHNSKNLGYSSNYLKRSLSTSDQTCLYNPLTLPPSMQNQQLKQSSSLTCLGRNKDASGSTGSAFKTKTLSPRSPSPHGSFALPPKKQKRYFSDTTEESHCTQCLVTLTGEKFSRCPNGHSTCSKCLEERVKLVLTGKAKESIKCLNRSCDSFYPISELKLSLPSMVVEILEDKLDQDYVDYISDMILKNASSDTESPGTSMDTDQGEVNQEEKYMKAENQSRKYLDCPENWQQMDEKTVTKNGYMLVKLQPGSNEYEEVVVRFFQSMVDHNVEVTSVHRVQNPIQWKYYTVKKTEMLQDNDGFGSVEEQQLFHGTNSSVVDAICRKGFDWRLCGKHGTMYGQGSYFAVNASYSHQYTDLKPAHRLVRSSMMMPNAMNMLPPSPSLLYPPVNVNFGQPLSQINPIMTNQAFPQSSNFSVLNLSYNTPSSINSSTGSSMNQSNNNISKNSQSSANAMLLQSLHKIGSISTPPVSSSSSSLHAFTLVQNTPSSASASQQTFTPNVNIAHTPSNIQSQLTRMFKVSPKPAIVRHISGQASTAITSSMDQSDRSSAKIFLARVLVGKYVGGTSKLRKPPPLYPKQDPYGKCYDSCVDDIMNPKIFVIFDSAQAYPEYLLEYSLSIE